MLGSVDNLVPTTMHNNMSVLYSLTVLLVGLLAIIQSQAQSLSSFLDVTPKYDIKTQNLTVFNKGKFQVSKPITLKKKKFSAPDSLLIVSPKEVGVYPVVLFIHGTLISNEEYSLLFQLIASHGYIIVAPQFFSITNIFPSQENEIETSACVANWLPSNLDEALQNRVNKGVKANLDKLAISGHSRGGKSAFALALGVSKTKLTVKISALIGVDPVAGISKLLRFPPNILTYEPNSFNLSIPTTVIGTGLGNHTTFLSPVMACAPNEVNHQEFYNECKDSSHFVIMDYGHMQMLDDFGLMSLLCAPGKGPTTTMKRTLSGIMVAFLQAYFRDDGAQYFAIMDDPKLAPTQLFVQYKGNLGPSSALV